MYRLTSASECWTEMVHCSSSPGVMNTPRLTIHGQEGRGREWVPVERAHMGHAGGDLVHQVGAAPERPQRRATSDRLGEAGQVRLDAEPLGGASRGHGGSGFHL